MNAAAEQATTQNLLTASAPSADWHLVDRLNERRMLSKAQVATRLGCSERSLERLVKQGRFPASKRYGRAVVWFESAVEHALGFAEQEQLQWQPVSNHPVDVLSPLAVQPVELLAPSLIPNAHELELEVSSHGARKPRKAAGNAKRREPSGASASDLEALGKLFKLPTV